ncbi:hypothetical protein TOPH_06531 [Tolypocladium ophioglossoides CBS 100239]|uniref:Uncharacterized protein n=1 Tax=Tolypocladium ophioglossoides (strain CBS 100239) TaxID=1163406 RepID=A0A0L0N469_TOLOC|nr:hypothetical protein TOPH_06531 [Tolypocladium ophioglossoides CBS 100239]
MPIVNHVVLASGAVVAVSVAVAAAMAMYESPELRRYADDIRRRIAVALHSIGDGINPPHREPRFNRPEDAEGFMQSRRADGAQPGVDADEETRRRQREELLYWNKVLLEKKEKEQGGLPALPDVPRPTGVARGTSFDDFLRQDESAEHGAFVFNTGADVRDSQAGLRHRGQGARGLATSLYANPFADEHHIDNDEVAEMGASYIAPDKDEGMSDIYSATTRDQDDIRGATLEPSPALIDVVSNPAQLRTQSQASATLERELGEDEYMSAGQDDRHEAYDSIQAWAHDSSRNFYSPLPVTPVAPVSEPELISDGELTPTDSMSLAGSGEDISSEAQSSRAGETGRPFDVMSESEGMLTPASWSEVGSVISENDAHAHGPMHA